LEHVATNIDNLLQCSLLLIETWYFGANSIRLFLPKTFEAPAINSIKLAYSFLIEEIYYNDYLA
jgi:hypothetical protein